MYVYIICLQQQYICIHNCLLCVIEGHEDEPITYPGLDNEAFDGMYYVKFLL